MGLERKSTVGKCLLCTSVDSFIKPDTVVISFCNHNTTMETSEAETEKSPEARRSTSLVNTMRDLVSNRVESKN